MSAAADSKMILWIFMLSLSTCTYPMVSALSRFPSALLRTENESLLREIKLGVVISYLLFIINNSI